VRLTKEVFLWRAFSGLFHWLIKKKQASAIVRQMILSAVQRYTSSFPLSSIQREGMHEVFIMLTRCRKLGSESMSDFGSMTSFTTKELFRSPHPTGVRSCGQLCTMQWPSPFPCLAI
jgi:hypothetical protein